MFYFAYYFVVVVFFVSIIFSFLATLSKNISEKQMEIQKTTKMKNAEKKNILKRTISTNVFTNSVLFLFVFL